MKAEQQCLEAEASTRLAARNHRLLEATAKDNAAMAKEHAKLLQRIDVRLEDELEELA
ncbi:MAG: hypothetical protein M2R45_05278 [Verrucomicrobia subdivision 3 bacterium]|nr:hypothetical protein [Limisphaerales bacterium]MCS1417476.1 hypothetical protein [Limisphaerales bacterium]